MKISNFNLNYLIGFILIILFFILFFGYDYFTDVYNDPPPILTQEHMQTGNQSSSYTTMSNYPDSCDLIQPGDCTSELCKNVPHCRIAKKDDTLCFCKKRVDNE